MVCVTARGRDVFEEATLNALVILMNMAHPLK